MGLCTSVAARRKKMMARDLQRYSGVIEALGFSQSEARTLYGYFAQADVQCRGDITLHELWKFLGVDRTGFTERAFSLFDGDGNGIVDFGEFLVSLYNYCSHTKMSLMAFAFDLYDLDGSGTIDLEEAVQLLSEIWGADFMMNQDAEIRETVKAFSKVGQGGAIDRHEFVKFATQHPMLLMPAYMFQDALQDRIAGKLFWKKTRARRLHENGLDDDLTGFLAKMVTMSLTSEKAINKYIDTSLTDAERRRRAGRKASLTSTSTREVMKKEIYLARNVAIAERVRSLATKARRRGQTRVGGEVETKESAGMAGAGLGARRRGSEGSDDGSGTRGTQAWGSMPKMEVDDTAKLDVFHPDFSSPSASSEQRKH